MTSRTPRLGRIEKQLRPLDRQQRARFLLAVALRWPQGVKYGRRKPKSASGG